MPNYFVNRIAQPAGEHEVHHDGCTIPPRPENRRALGYFSNCHEAVRAARDIYVNVDGCAFCCRDCHNR